MACRVFPGKLKAAHISRGKGKGKHFLILS
jgi:hypothetical protein